jgi:excinuclease ABC subunit C
MVVFVSGKPARSEYRRFKIKTVKGINDYDMMREMIRRRFTRLLEEKQTPPDLVVIDGGKGHLSSAWDEFRKLGLQGKIPMISIAKQHEHLFEPGRERPHIYPQNSPMLQTIQHLRDEAHRFAITFHRRLHRREALLSRLDEVPGVGPKTRERLLKKFGSVKAIGRATAEELSERGGTSRKTSEQILKTLNG